MKKFWPQWVMLFLVIVQTIMAFIYYSSKEYAKDEDIKFHLECNSLGGVSVIETNGARVCFKAEKIKRDRG